MEKQWINAEQTKTIDFLYRAAWYILPPSLFTWQSLTHLFKTRSKKLLLCKLLVSHLTLLQVIHSFTGATSGPYCCLYNIMFYTLSLVLVYSQSMSS